MWLFGYGSLSSYQKEQTCVFSARLLEVICAKVSVLDNFQHTWTKSVIWRVSVFGDCVTLCRDWRPLFIGPSWHYTSYKFHLGLDWRLQCCHDPSMLNRPADGSEGPVARAHGITRADTKEMWLMPPLVRGCKDCSGLNIRGCMGKVLPTYCLSPNGDQLSVQLIWLSRFCFQPLLCHLPAPSHFSAQAWDMALTVPSKNSGAAWLQTDCSMEATSLLCNHGQQ